MELFPARQSRSVRPPERVPITVFVVFVVWLGSFQCLRDAASFVQTALFTGPCVTRWVPDCFVYRAMRYAVGPRLLCLQGHALRGGSQTALLTGPCVTRWVPDCFVDRAMRYAVGPRLFCLQGHALRGGSQANPAAMSTPDYETLAGSLARTHARTHGHKHTPHTQKSRHTRI